MAGWCPDLLLQNVPLIYPFIINDPGEGSQAKRRGHAVVVDHLTPAMTRAETYGPLAALNQLVNEYYTVEKLDASKLPFIQQQIWELIEQTNLKADLDLKAMLTRDHGDHKHEWDEELRIRTYAEFLRAFRVGPRPQPRSMTGSLPVVDRPPGGHSHAPQKLYLTLR